MNINRFVLLHSVVARRIFGLFIVCALVPVCALSLVSLLQVSGAMKKASLERLLHTSRNAGMTVVEGLYLLETELMSFSRVSSATLGQEIKQYQRDKNAADDMRFLGFTLFESDGSNRVLQGKPCPHFPPGPAGKHLDSGKPLLFWRVPAPATERLYMAVPMKRGIRDKAYLVAEINPVYLWSLVMRTLPPETALCVIDPHGHQLFSSSSTPLPRYIPLVIQKLSTLSVGHFEWDGRDDAATVSYWTAFLTPLYQTESWVIVASQQRNVTLGPIHLFGRTFLLIICLAFVIVVYLSHFLIRRSLDPLLILKNGALQLSQGDLKARVALRSRDEFQDLAETFNDMGDHLQRHFLRIQETARVVQDFLGAHDRAAVINVALSAHGSAILCQAMSLTMFNIADETVAATYCHPGTDHAPCDRPQETVTVLQDTDLERLRQTNEYLHLTGAGRFAPLLRPVDREGTRDFYLFPIFVRGNLAGLLVIAYVQSPSRIREDLIRARLIADEVSVALDNLRLIEELHQLNWGTINALANAVDAKSPWTAGHSERVTGLALQMGHYLGMDEQELELLHLGGIFHDIGKIAVPEAILDKQGKLTEEEYALITAHPLDGGRILEPISAYENVIPMVVQHHEWFNGNGYPFGLSGDDISIGGRILAVADVYDALISNRPYRPGWDRDRVLAHLRGKAGSQFDPRCVEALLAVVDAGVSPPLELAAKVPPIPITQEVQPS